MKIIKDGQFVLTNTGNFGVVSHRGSTQTYTTYWVRLFDGNMAIVHEDNLTPITQPIYDIARECV